MAEKDLSKKYLESFPDVFVDIYNTLLFQENYIKEEELEKGPTESIYKSAKENIRNQFRDTTKYTRKGQYNLALLGIENQGEVDLDMPIRVMGSGRSAVLLPLSPLRTVRESFPSYGSSTYKPCCSNRASSSFSIE